MELESAIPSHLLRERTIAAHTPENYQPPFPAYSARFAHDVQNLVMAIIGAQHSRKPEGRSAALLKLVDFVIQGPEDAKPRYWQLSAVTDVANTYNEALIAYWPSKSAYEEWTLRSGFTVWWQSRDRETDQNGWFKEVFFPTIDRFETVFSDNEVPEGGAHMRDHMSGPIREHVYWGSMRDRLAASQTDHLTGSKCESSAIGTVDKHEKRCHVEGRQNLAIIRSGQDWSNTNVTERKLYLETMHPVLVKGMDFLTHQGGDVGCFCNRFMEVLNPQTFDSDTQKTFGLGYFDDLASLKLWSKQHKTHLDIFGRFLQYARELDNNVTLRLFHEVLVVMSSQQDLDYIDCHPRTGVLASRA